MTAGGVDWTPALVALGLGLLLGLVVAVRALLSTKRAAATGKAGERDLVARRDALVQQLRELDDTGSEPLPPQRARERYRLELEAARTVLALEQRAPVAGGETPRTASRRDPAPPGADRGALRGFVWGVATATAVGLLGFFLSQSAKPREAGGSVTGDVPGRAAQGSAPPASADPDEVRIDAALARDPDDIEARLAKARILLERQEYMAVWGETTRVLEKSPRNSRALSYQALVRLQMGQAEVALDLLRKVLKADPGLIDAYVHLALVHLRLGRSREADADIAQAVKRFPDQAKELRQALAEMHQSEADAPAPPPGAPNPHAGVATPGGEPRPGTRAAPGPPASTAEPAARVSGTVELDPALREPISPQAVLFVFVRAAGASGGPPIAARRLPAKFPVRFEISEADAMLGQPFPDPLLIEARLDSDGDPTTRPPTDPKARLDGVRAGRDDVRLVLRRP
ncbi:MAG: hypothetical protein NVSMB23_16540 [Myxococcales bacterium]